MLSTNSSKRARLSEAKEQLQSQQFQQMHNLQPQTLQNQQLFHHQPQHSIQRKLYSRNQVLPDFTSQPQQPPSISSVSMDSVSQLAEQMDEQEEAMTSQDMHRLEQIIDLVFPHKSQAARGAAMRMTNSTTSSSSSNRSPSPTKNGHITLDLLPVLADSVIEKEPMTSPLNLLINHTFPDPIVRLVKKLKKISLSPGNVIPISSLPATPISDDDMSSLPAPDPPSNELCQQLLSNYFNRFNIIIPILDRRRFWNQLRDKSKYSELLTNAALAVAAARFSDDKSLRKTSDKPGGVFYDSTKKLLDTLYDIPKLETIQALLLLQHAEVSVSRIGSGLIYFGMAVQMAHTMNLGWNDSTLLPEENEERRRVFYCIYCCERWATFSLGKPSVIDDININVPLPTLASFDSLTGAFFIAWIKLSRILGQIWKFGYSSQPKASHATWMEHVNDQKSMLRQIRSMLAKWIKELPDELQYQYLPNTDPRSIFQMAGFSVFSGYINILFHTCMIVLHQPYLTQAYENSKFEMQKQDPIKLCLTAATTITDIAKTTRKYDSKAFCNFQYPIYGLLQSTIIELVILVGTQEYESPVKKSLNDSVEELKHAADNSGFMFLRETVKELELVIKSSDMMAPFPFIMQILESRAGFVNNNINGSNVTGSMNLGRNTRPSKYSLSPTMSDTSIRSTSSGISDKDSKTDEADYLSSSDQTESQNTNGSMLTDKMNLSLTALPSTTPQHASSIPATQNQQANMYTMSPNSLFNTQGQQSLPFHQIQPNIPPSAQVWDHSSFYMSDDLYDFVPGATTQITADVSETDGNALDDFSGLYFLPNNSDRNGQPPS